MLLVFGMMVMALMETVVTNFAKFGLLLRAFLSDQRSTSLRFDPPRKLRKEIEKRRPKVLLDEVHAFSCNRFSHTSTIVRTCCVEQSKY